MLMNKPSGPSMEHQNSTLGDRNDVTFESTVDHLGR